MDDDLRRFEAEVASYIVSGWTPVGAVTVVPRRDTVIQMQTYYQALWYRNQ